MTRFTSEITARRTSSLRPRTIALIAALTVAGCAPVLPTDMTPPHAAVDEHTAASTPAATSSLSATGSLTATDGVAQPAPTIGLPADVVVAWGKDDGLWVQSGEAPAQLLPDTAGGLTQAFGKYTVTLSPNGRHVAYLTASPTDVHDLRVADVADGTVRTLVSGARLARDVPAPEDMPAGTITQIEPSYLGWLPDSSAVGFTNVANGPGDFGGWRERDDLWLARLDSGTPTEVLAASQGGQFVFAPDGRRVAISRLDGSTMRATSAVIAVADLSDGTVRTLLTHAPVSSETDWLPYNEPQWTLDGAALLVAVPNVPPDVLARYDGWAAFDDPFTLLRLSLDGATTTVVDAGPRSIVWTKRYHARWSPNGHAVAYLAPPDIDPDAATAYPPPSAGPLAGPRTLVIAAGDGADPAPYDVVADGLAAFEWSPDGTRFAYRAFARDHRQGAPTQPLLVGARGVPPRELADVPRDAGVRWLDDAHVLVSTADGLKILRLGADGAVVGRGEVVRGAVWFGDAVRVPAAPTRAAVGYNSPHAHLPIPLPPLQPHLRLPLPHRHPDA